MATVRVSRVLDAPPARVWPFVADIEGHAGWQVDVEAIRFTSRRHRGVGATYECATRLGPVRMTIPMEVVGWREGKSVSVRYEGSLSGGGTITVERLRRRRTKVTWAAHIRLPWWMGGPVGALAAAQVLRVVWKANLTALAREVGERVS